MYSSSSPQRIEFLRNAIRTTEETYEKYAAGKIPNELRNRNLQEKDQKNNDKVTQWSTLPETSAELELLPLEHLGFSEVDQPFSETQSATTRKRKADRSPSEEERREPKTLALRRSTSLEK
jgi:hypothetical protein